METPGSQGSQDPPGTGDRRATEARSDWMDPRENRVLLEKRARPETEETWERRASKERRDRPVPQGRLETKVQKEGEGCREQRVNPGRPDPEGCRETWAYPDFLEYRDPREKPPQTITSRPSAGESCKNS